MKRKFININVLEAARKRISFLFDEFENINVSISSGKDSTVLYYLCLQEAIKRKQKITAFFLDQEAEYESSIKLIKIMMKHKKLVPSLLHNQPTRKGVYCGMGNNHFD